MFGMMVWGGSEDRIAIINSGNHWLQTTLSVMYFIFTSSRLYSKIEYENICNEGNRTVDFMIEKRLPE